MANEYIQQTGTANPFNGINVVAASIPTLADIDGDGDLDAIVGATLKYYKNTGSSTAPLYTAQTGTANPFNGIDIWGGSAPTLADLDGDGDLDAIVGKNDGTLNYYENTGSRTAPLYTGNGINVGNLSTPTLADIDGDGDLDAIVGKNDGTLNYYKNIGSRTAPLYTGTANPFNGIDIGYYSAPTFADIDGDGDLDAIVGEEDGILNYYKNTGSRTAPFYTEQIGTANPFNGIDIGTSSTPTLADIDGDGDLDAIVGENDGILNYYKNTGSSTAPTNSAPSAVSLNNQLTAIAENTSTTTRIKVADITITDDALGTNALSVSGTDASVFEVDATGLYLKANTALNFEAKTSYNVTVNVDDSTVGSTPDATTNFTLNVTNVNEAPTVTSGANTNFAENGTGTVYTVTGTDPDAATTLTYSISGTDATLFNINSSTGAVTFKTTPNFESPTDSGTNNIYDINVIASDGSLTNSKAVAITVTNVNEAPTVANAIANQTIAVNASLNYTFEANTFSDVDSDLLTYTVTLANGTALPSWLTFNATTRTFSGTPTTPGNLDIKIVANDGNGGTIADEFQLSIVTPIVGTAANDSVFAISPAEIIDGGGGIDEVNYARSNSGVTIDLETGKGIGGYAQGDILTNIEKLTGSFYNDHLKGNAAYNYFYGGNGNDLLEAGSGGGFFYGENGNDTIYGGEGQDRLYGGEGQDLLDGKAGNDMLLGGNGLDSLFGGAGNDILYGDDGNDELTGTNSTAKGIGEIDILYGGSGSDTFILGNTANIFYDDGNPLNMGRTDYARIKDYNQAQDIIKLTNGKDYYLGGSPGGIVLGTSIFIDNDGMRGLTSRDELIANLEGTNLILGLVTGSTQGFSFI
jgi:hypothetical protein